MFCGPETAEAKSSLKLDGGIQRVDIIRKFVKCRKTKYGGNINLFYGGDTEMTLMLMN